jgi:predicted DNA binding CopG/RHH family protein
MEKKPKSEIAKTKPINIMLQEELITRVNTVCADQDMTIQEFITDAIIEKLELVYKERRTKGRL